MSDISGRGVGLDVVKTTIESLGGTIEISSTEGKGSLFSIQLPLTLSIISVMLVELEKRFMQYLFLLLSRQQLLSLQIY